MSLGSQAAKSITFSVASGVVQRLVSFACTLVLARLLDPATFGLFALASLTIDAFGLFKSLGLDSALIQRKDDVPRAANTAFCLIPLLGALFYVLLLLSSPALGLFFGNAELPGVLSALGLVFVIGCVARVPAALLEKSLSFGKLSIAELAGSLCFSLVAVLLASLGFKIWSLVYAYLLRTVVQGALVWGFARWRPRLEFSLPLALEMFRFGRFQLLDTVLWFLRRNLDNVLVGWLLGVTKLGFYAIAFNLSNILVDYFGSKVVRVIYPACARIQDRLSEVQAAFLRVHKYVALVAVPFGIVLSVLGADFVRISLGEKWAETAPALRILTWGGVFSTLAAPCGAIFLALARPDLSVRVTSAQLAVFALLIVPLSRFDLPGVSAVVAFAYLVGLLLSYFYVQKVLAVDWKQILQSLRSTLLLSGSALAIWLALRAGISLQTLLPNIYAQFGLQLLMAGSLFLIAAYLFDRPAIAQALGLLASSARIGGAPGPRLETERTS